MSRILGIGGQQKEYSHKNSLILGASTFFLPCGFTQAMQVIAISTGSFLYGGLVMGLFALGTVPGLLGVGGLTSVAKGALARKFFKFAGLVVLLFAIFNLSNGLNLTGFNFAYGQTENAVNLNDPNVTLENGVQVVRMTETGSGYSPNSFTIRQGIPVRWIIDAQAPYSCAASLSMPKYNIRKYLKQGENIIEFTPKETGRIPFSCSMGMYTGVFNVVDKNSKAPVSPPLTRGARGVLPLIQPARASRGQERREAVAEARRQPAEVAVAAAAQVAVAAVAGAAARKLKKTPPKLLPKLQAILK